MANVEHSTLTTTNLHENKGVSTATDNTVATAVTGATVWAKLTASNLTGTGNSFGAQLLHYRGSTSDTLTSATYVKRTLNVSVTNEISGASVASSQITLPAGTYYIEANASAYHVFGHRLKLKNMTDNTDTIFGTSEYTDADVNTRSWVVGRFTIAGAKDFQLQHRATGGSNSGGSSSSSGSTETYVDVRIWKVL